jgi:hypothetical protein
MHPIAGRPEVVAAVEWPGSTLPELRRLIAQLNPGGCTRPVELDGEYYVLPFEIRFPGDVEWRRNLH